MNADLGMGQLQVVNDPEAARDPGHQGKRGPGVRERGGRDDDSPWSEDNGPPWSYGPGPARGDSSVPVQDNAACRAATAQARGGDR